MRNRILSWAVFCCLLLQLLVLPAAAEGTDPAPLTREEDLFQKISYFYDASLEYAEKSSFEGYCAFYVNTQLYLLGINRQYVAGNGNEEWENYRYLDKTNGGYEVHAYGAYYDSLTSSLETISGNGTRNVYNILIGFQRGVTTAGRKYGHTCFIHAIIDGKVYFSDSQTVEINGKEYPEGTPVACTIKEFGEFYEPWTFEGAIHFTYPDDHTCDRGQRLFAQENHPHYACYQCSVCGGAWMDETVAYQEDCYECTHPGTPVLDALELYYLVGTPVTFTWQDTERTASYELILERQNESGAFEHWQTVSQVGSGLTLEPVPGIYRATVRAYNDRGDYVDSTPSGFQVVEQWDCTLYGHVLREDQTVAATCTEDGSITYTCAHCQELPVTVLPALGHSFGGGKMVTAPTQEQDGLRLYTCATCGQEKTQTLPALNRNPFVDVRGNAYYYASVIWAYESELTLGMGNQKFSPTDSATRAQVVTFLWRMAGCPEPEAESCAFDDVKLESYYGKALLWAVENGITTGMSSTEFAPDSPVTRGQFVTFLHRLAGSPETACGTIFRDTGLGKFYDNAVLWATRTGITTGIGDGKFAPNDTCVRGQIVTFLDRYAQQIPQGNPSGA